MQNNVSKPKELKILDFRLSAFTDADAKLLLEEVGSGLWQQIQVRVDSQMLANRVRAKIHELALADGRQFEMTILGSGAAVGVKMHIPSQYIWEPLYNRAITRQEYEDLHGKDGKI